MHGRTASVCTGGQSPRGRSYRSVRRLLYTVAGKMWCAIEIGTALDRRNIEARVAGGIVFGLSATVNGEITFAGGDVVQGNVDDQDNMRVHRCQSIAVRVLEIGGRMNGVGAPGTSPAAPAFANAVFTLSGVCVRELSLRSYVIHLNLGLYDAISEHLFVSELLRQCSQSHRNCPLLTAISEVLHGVSEKLHRWSPGICTVLQRASLKRRGRDYRRSPALRFHTVFNIIYIMRNHVEGGRSGAQRRTCPASMDGKPSRPRHICSTNFPPIPAAASPASATSPGRSSTSTSSNISA